MQAASIVWLPWENVTTSRYSSLSPAESGWAPATKRTVFSDWARVLTFSVDAPLTPTLVIEYPSGTSGKIKLSPVPASILIGTVLQIRTCKAPSGIGSGGKEEAPLLWRESPTAKPR